jgi:predicted RNA-binding protein with PUA-like domain
MKKEKLLANVPLIRIPRLSVMPLNELEFSKIIEMSERKI